jgi:hypothetical protein
MKTSNSFKSSWAAVTAVKAKDRTNIKTKILKPFFKINPPYNFDVYLIKLKQFYPKIKNHLN